MKFLQALLKIEPVLRLRGMTVSGNAQYVAVTAGESLVTLTRTDEGAYLVSKLQAGGVLRDLHVCRDPDAGALLSAILKSF
jgi:hypothetical protein